MFLWGPCGFTSLAGALLLKIVTQETRQEASSRRILWCSTGTWCENRQWCKICTPEENGRNEGVGDKIRSCLNSAKRQRQFKAGVFKYVTEAAEAHNVSYRTLLRRIKGLTKPKSVAHKKQCPLSSEEEATLVDWLKYLLQGHLVPVLCRVGVRISGDICVYDRVAHKTIIWLFGFGKNI